jgi:hypothetical protein
VTSSSYTTYPHYTRMCLETVLFRYLFIESFKILVVKVISDTSIDCRIPYVRTRLVP